MTHPQKYHRTFVNRHGKVYDGGEYSDVPAFCYLPDTDPIAMTLTAPGVTDVSTRFESGDTVTYRKAGS